MVTWGDVLTIMSDPDRSGGIMKNSFEQVKRSEKFLFAYVLYRQNSGQIPFIISGDSKEAVMGVERRVIKSQSSSFDFNFYELGEWGEVYGEISSERVSFRKIYPSREKDVILYNGRKSGDNVYSGIWTFNRGLTNLTGDFNMILDIVAPL
jgi:hypothetical protein